ncbi:Hypp9362 [Branchiostoma lanceolatum]|uniref:Hypp9362 protein n=1 Tax=Branchiostoma lanceolatum TaxID=7740 RepID=A0A8S4MM20_BRALA|nr:Hypp9362 [Branchiostoma lanceolatum]
MRLRRHPDQGHVDTLAAKFKSCPDGPYTILAVHIPGLAPELFDSRKLQDYTYEVIGGNHTRLALQKLHSEDPNEDIYKTTMARVYSDRLFSFWAAAYAEAGYTDEADLTTVEPLLTKDKESRWKYGLITIQAFKAFLHIIHSAEDEKKNIAKLKVFRANRFNIVFEAAAATYLHKDDIQKMRMHQEHERQTMSNMMGQFLTMIGQVHLFV